MLAHFRVPLTGAPRHGKKRAMTARGLTRLLSVAPMLDRTDRHQRVWMRALTRETLLYTEMIHARAVIHGDRARLLAFAPIERPLALQLGGSDPAILAIAAKIAEDFGFDEVNLNVGCPSDKVQQGEFGAFLMAYPERVAECVAAMRGAVSLPVTVKHRIGIDTLDRYEDMLRFVDVVASAGADRFTVHARKAWLQGLSPKENRDVPPLRYPEVWQLKAERPALAVEVNGGIRSLEAAAEHLQHVDAAMIGRAALDNPWLFSQVDRQFFGRNSGPVAREEAVQAYLPYLAEQIQQGEKWQHLTRHLAPLYHGISGARRWRRLMGEGSASAGVAHIEAELLSLRDISSDLGLETPAI